LIAAAESTQCTNTIIISVNTMSSDSRTTQFSHMVREQIPQEVTASVVHHTRQDDRSLVFLGLLCLHSFDLTLYCLKVRLIK